MPRPLALNLTPDERTCLREMRDHHPRPHMREKAAALLKVAEGCPGSRIARGGLLKPRKPETLYRWVSLYRTEGIAGLRVRAGRGRKPAFSPSVQG